MRPTKQELNRIAERLDAKRIEAEMELANPLGPDKNWRFEREWVSSEELVRRLAKRVLYLQEQLGFEE